MFISTKKKDVEFKQLSSQYQTEKEEIPVTLFMKDQQSIIQDFSGLSGRSGRSNVKLQKIIIEEEVKGINAETLIDEENKNDDSQKVDIQSIFDNLTKINIKAYSTNEILQFLNRYP